MSKLGLSSQSVGGLIVGSVLEVEPEADDESELLVEAESEACSLMARSCGLDFIFGLGVFGDCDARALLAEICMIGRRARLQDRIRGPEAHTLGSCFITCYSVRTSYT
jgi:hypothetical protein